MLVLPIVVLGYGAVSRAFIAQIISHRAEYRSRFDVDLYVAAVRTHRAQTEITDDTIPPRPQWSAPTSLDDLIARVGARVVVQAVPSVDADAAGAVADGVCALRNGAHLVTATKTTLLHGWCALDAVSRETGRAVKLSGTTGAMLPAADVARSLRNGIHVTSVSGCVNGTATFVLDRLSDGDSLGEAVEAARRAGIAEGDPSADLSGRDVAMKIQILTGLLWGRDPGAAETILEPITPAIRSAAVRAKGRGQRLRQVAVADLDIPDLVTVSIRAVTRDSPLGALNGPEKAVIFDCGEFGPVTVTGGQSSPTGAAMAMIKDTLSLALETAPGLR